MGESVGAAIERAKRFAQYLCYFSSGDGCEYDDSDRKREVNAAKNGGEARKLREALYGVSQ